MASDALKNARKGWMGNGRIFVRPRKDTGPKDSWWTKHAAPDADRAGFNHDAHARHVERMTLGSDATRSLGKALDP